MTDLGVALLVRVARRLVCRMLLAQAFGATAQGVLPPMRLGLVRVVSLLSRKGVRVNPSRRVIGALVVCAVFWVAMDGVLLLVLRPEGRKSTCEVSPDNKVRRYLVYLKYWTLELGPLKYYSLQILSSKGTWRLPCAPRSDLCCRCCGQSLARESEPQGVLRLGTAALRESFVVIRRFRMCSSA